MSCWRALLRLLTANAQQLAETHLSPLWAGLEASLVFAAAYPSSQAGASSIEVLQADNETVLLLWSQHSSPLHTCHSAAHSARLLSSQACIQSVPVTDCADQPAIEASFGLMWCGPCRMQGCLQRVWHSGTQCAIPSTRRYASVASWVD